MLFYRRYFFLFFPSWRTSEICCFQTGSGPLLWKFHPLLINMFYRSCKRKKKIRCWQQTQSSEWLLVSDQLSPSPPHSLPLHLSHNFIFISFSFSLFLDFSLFIILQLLVSLRFVYLSLLVFIPSLFLSVFLSLSLFQSRRCAWVVSSEEERQISILGSNSGLGCFFVFFFNNDFHLIQDPVATRGRELRSKKHPSKQYCKTDPEEA